MALELSEVVLASGRVARVFRGGPAGARPVVWFHPANGTDENDVVANALAARYDVYAPLAPGFHDIGELDEIRDVHDLALHYDDLFEALGLSAAACVGHSFGGMVAAELAAHFPPRVAKLALLAPVGLWNDRYPVIDLFATPPLELMDVIWADPESEIALAAKAARSPGVSRDGSTQDTLQLVQDEAFVENMVRTVMGFTAVAKFLFPLPDKGLSRRLYRVRADTLIVWGAKDRLAPPEYAADFQRLIPGSRVEIIDDAGHMVSVEAFERVQKLLAGLFG